MFTWLSQKLRPVLDYAGPMTVANIGWGAAVGAVFFVFAAIASAC